MALFDAFLKLDGIKGESADSKHKGEIDIESFSWGMTQTGVSATGGGGGAGKVRLIDFCLVAKTSSASPLLMLNCANGAHIKEANFVVRKAGGEQLEYLKIKLTDVLISSYKPGSGEFIWFRGGNQTATDDWEARQWTWNPPGNAPAADDWQASQWTWNSPGTTAAGDGSVKPGSEIPTDQFTLNFAKIEFQYQPQGADGKAQGGPIIAGWDVKGNQKV